VKLLIGLLCALLLVGTAVSCRPQYSGPGAQRGVTVIFFDATDIAGPKVFVALRTLVSEALDDVRRGDRLVGYVLDNHSRLPREVWFANSPGRGAEANPWTEGAAYLDDCFRTQVAQPLDSVLTSLASSTDSAQVSEIGEGLAVIARAEGLGRGSPRQQLLVASDLMQHSLACSLYNEPLPEQLPFAPVDLLGVRSTLLVLLR